MTDEERLVRAIHVSAFLMFASGGYVLYCLLSQIAPWFISIPVGIAPCAWFGWRRLNQYFGHSNAVSSQP